jgi:hypothetical protein
MSSAGSATTDVPHECETSVDGKSARTIRRHRGRTSADPSRSSTRSSDAAPVPTPQAHHVTVRISVNIPLDARQWLARQAREQQRFVSEIVMKALDRYGDDADPPSGRARRVTVPDGTICNIVLPRHDRERIDVLAALKNTTRSALVTEILRQASANTLN